MLKVRKIKNALELEPSELRMLLAYKRVLMEYDSYLLEVMWTDGDNTPVKSIAHCVHHDYAYRYKVIGAVTRGPEHKYDYVVIDVTSDVINDIIKEFNRQADSATSPDHIYL